VPQVIHVHHHYYPALGDDDDSGGDPAARFNPDFYSFEDSAFDAMPAANRNWGDLGVYGYLGEKAGNDGLIVSRVSPNSAAAKLGLVRGDVITQINDVEVGDLSFRELQVLFTRLSTTPKIKVTMKVWNALTGRGESLQTEFVNDPPQSDDVDGN
jgi:S1-C subfamily serine protease